MLDDGVLVVNMVNYPTGVNLTFKTFSIDSPLFMFRIRCASSSVMRCCLVSWSVMVPEVALLTPATSAPIAFCGACFASMKQSAIIPIKTG